MQIRRSLLLLIELISFLFVCSCNSNKADIKQPVIGVWKLQKSSSAQNKISKTFPSGNGIHLFFDSTRYREFYNGSITSMGHYRIVPDTMKNGEILNRIFFKPEIYAEDTSRFFITVKDSLLIITGDFADKGTRFYKKISN